MFKRKHFLPDFIGKIEQPEQPDKHRACQYLEQLTNKVKLAKAEEFKDSYYYAAKGEIVPKMSCWERFSQHDIIGMLKHTSAMGLIGYDFDWEEVRPDGCWVLYYKRKYIITTEDEMSMLQ